MTLDYYIYEIRELLPGDWLDVTNKHITRWINLQRSLWLKNEINQGRYIDDKIKQTIIVDTVLVNASEIAGIKANSVLLKSSKEIPYTIILKTTDTITSIHNADILGESYNYVTKEDAVYSGNGKMNTRDIFSFRYNKNIYIKCQKANPKIKLINKLVIEGVFEDPIEVARDFNSTGDFNELKMEYPISDALWNYMKEQIINNGLISIQAENVEEKQGRS